MKNKVKTLLTLTFSTFMAGLLAIGSLTTSAVASGSSPSSLSAGVNVKARVNNAVSMAEPLSNAAKGAKVFGVDTTATLVVDEHGVAPTHGGLVSVEIRHISGGVPACYLMIFESTVAADTTEAGSVSRMLVPPLSAVTSEPRAYEFAYPKQFHKGLVVLMAGAGAANCRASIGWIRNGGAD